MLPIEMPQSDEGWLCAKLTDDRAKATDLEKDRVAAKEARSKNRATKEELHQAADTVSGKPFLLRTKFGDPKYAPLDRLWSSADAYVDLAASAAHAAKYFKDRKDHEVEKLFWSQLKEICPRDNNKVIIYFLIS